ncbi:outer membrane beta-barrel protein [Spirosoma panaciterrae]|uniref:outer membrane beta-barrel protein n=1 Tax=Spirosoma panaciterrae TaxID=496058 RepID=UPI000377B3FC|nr:outer membrane beta-barrel protein [Spirosoma panaciterrae]
MKTLTLLLVMVGLVPAFAQKKFAVSVHLAPIYGHNDSKIRLGGGPNQPPASEFIMESNGLSYQLGLSARYAFSPKWSIMTGIWAAHVVSSKLDVVQDGIPYSIRYTYSHPFSNSYQSPLLINYQVSTKRLSPYVSFGATFAYRRTSYVDLSGNGEFTPIKIGKPVVVTPLLGVGVLYNLTEHLTLIAQPTLQYNVESHSAYDYYHSYSLSLQTQLMYRF